MAKFKLQFITFREVNNNNTIKCLSQTISDYHFNNTNNSISNYNDSFCYTYDESFSIKENSQKTLSFKMCRDIIRTDRIEINPFVDMIKIGAQLLLTDKNDKEHLFTVTNIEYEFLENNTIYSYQCQDSFTYQLSRQNASYVIKNDIDSNNFLGAHEIDWWVNKIQVDCHITYTYQPLAIDFICPKHSYKGVLKHALPRFLEDGSESIYYQKITFSGEGSANVLLIKLAQQFDLQLETYEFLDPESNVLETYYWFIPNKELRPSGLKYSPYREIQNFNLAHQGEALSSILNVESNLKGDRLISLLPTVPDFFSNFFITEEWKKEKFYQGFFSEKIHQYIWGNFDREGIYQLNKDIKQGIPNYWDKLEPLKTSFYFKNHIYVPILGLKIVNHKVFFPSNFYDSFAFNVRNTYSYIKFSTNDETIIISTSINDNWMLAYQQEGQLIELNSKEYRELSKTLLQEGCDGLFISIPMDSPVSKIETYSLWYRLYRQASQEEKDFAQIADTCPWLENKLIDFSYFLNNHLITKNRYKELQNLFQNDLRIVNGELLYYSKSYYNALQAKTNALSTLTSQIDRLGALFHAEVLGPVINPNQNKDSTEFSTQYTLLFNTKSSSNDMYHYYDTISEYINKYYSTEQMFLKNVSLFRRFFEQPCAIPVIKYTTDISINNNAMTDEWYSFIDQDLIVEIQNMPDDILFNMNPNSLEYGKPYNDIYIDNQTKLSDPEIVWKNQLNNKKYQYSILENLPDRYQSAAGGKYNPDITYFEKQGDKYIPVTRQDMINNYKQNYDYINNPHHFYKYQKTYPCITELYWKEWNPYISRHLLEYSSNFLKTTREISSQDTENLEMYYDFHPLNEYYYYNDIESPAALLEQDLDNEKIIKTNMITYNNYMNYYRLIPAFPTKHPSNLSDFIQTSVKQYYNKNVTISKQGYSKIGWDPAGNLVEGTSFMVFPEDNLQYYVRNIDVDLDKNGAENKPYMIENRLHTFKSFINCYGANAEEIKHFFAPSSEWEFVDLNTEMLYNLEDEYLLLKLNLTENNLYDNKIVKDIDPVDPKHQTYTFGLLTTNLNLVRDYLLTSQIYFPNFAKEDNGKTLFSILSNTDAGESLFLGTILIGNKKIKRTILQYKTNSKSTVRYYNVLLLKKVKGVLNPLKTAEDALETWYDQKGHEIDITQMPDFVQDYYIFKPGENDYVPTSTYDPNLIYYFKDENQSWKRAWTYKQLKDPINHFGILNTMKKKQVESFSPFNQNKVIPVKKYKKINNIWVYDKIENKTIDLTDSFFILENSHETSMEQLSNGMFWATYKNNESNLVREYALDIESTLSAYWSAAYAASKGCKFFLPEHWQWTINQNENNFVNQILIVDRDANNKNKIKSIRLSNHFLPVVEERPGSYYKIYSISNRELSEGQKTHSLDYIRHLEKTWTNAYNYLKLNNFQNLSNYVYAVENDVRTIYSAIAGGQTWTEALQEYTNGEINYPYGGFNELFLWAMQAANYHDTKYIEYDDALAKHNAIWDKIYRNYPSLILEKNFSNEDASSSLELLKTAQMAFKDYNRIERNYNIGVIDIHSLQGYTGQEIHIGSAIELEADELYPAYDDLKNSLQQFLFVTDINYNLRDDKDVHITVNDIKYQDKVIAQLIKLIR